MEPMFDELLATLVAVMHYECDRHDPEWPDFCTGVVVYSMFNEFELLGLAERTEEGGRTTWHATPELKRLAARAGIELSESLPPILA